MVEHTATTARWYIHIYTYIYISDTHDMYHGRKDLAKQPWNDGNIMINDKLPDFSVPGP